jgi:hypothetical protein
MTGLPAPEWAWHLAATHRLLEAATADVLAVHLSSSGTDVIASPDLTDALVEFADVLDQNEPERFFTNLAISLMYGIGVAHPYTGDDTFARIVVTDTDGTAVSDPDSEVRGDIEGTAALAAARFTASAISRDVPTAVAVFNTVERSGDPDLFALFTRIVLHQAGRMILAAAAGHVAETSPVDARDLSPDDEHLLHPHGDAAYGLTIYPVDHPDGITRNDVAHTAHALLAEQTTDTLCGVEHTEDVPDAGLPHTARAKFQKILAERRAQGGEWVALRVWQHFGTCPTP